MIENDSKEVLLRMFEHLIEKEQTKHPGQNCMERRESKIQSKLLMQLRRLRQAKSVDCVTERVSKTGVGSSDVGRANDDGIKEEGTLAQSSTELVPP